MNIGGSNTEMQEKIKSIKARIERLIEAGHLEEAKAALLKYDSKMPGDPDICSMLAVIYIIEGSPDKAEAIILEGLKKDSVQFDLLFNLAYIREQKGLYEEALELYTTAGTAANDGMRKKNVDEAINRLQGMDRRLEIKDKARIVFFVKEGMDNFLGDIINGLSSEYRVRKIIVGDFKQIDAGMEWADVCWFEWCDELVVYGSRLPLAREKKIICRLHSYEAFTEYIHNVAWDNIDRVIFVAKHIRDFVLEKQQELKPEQVVIIPNGIDLRKYLFKNRAPGFNVAYAGYINYKKGPMLLLHTFKALYDKDHRYKLYIAGKFQDYRYELYFKQMIKEFGLENNIFFNGWQDDIDKWLEDKNYIICTSVLEGNPVALMEAMSKGIKPVIHNFVGAGNIYPANYIWNTIEEAVNIIKAGHYNSEEYREFIATCFSLEKQIKKIKELLTELLQFRWLLKEIENVLKGVKNPGEFMMDDLTVLIPCYNRAKMLKDDLDRGLKLGNQPKLIVDDCSTDNLEALNDIEKECKRYNSHLIRKDKNEGLAQARWTGLQNIKTAFTAFVDDDDMLLCLNRENAANDISRLNSDCVLLMPRYVVNYNSDGLAIGYDREAYNNLTSEEVLVKIASTGEIRAMLAGGSIGINGILRECSSLKEFRVSEDFVMLARIFANNRSKKVYTTDSLIHVRRISGQSLSKTLTPYKLALGLLAQSVACYYCMRLGAAGKEEVLKWMKARATLIQKLYGFGESFETELVAYLTGEISEEVFIRFIALHGLELENGLDQLAPELREMRAMFYNEPEPKKLFANVKVEELPQVSVIIPTFNRKSMLKRNIDYVLKQDYPNIEVIVSDDCSTDGTDEMVRKDYGFEGRLKYCRNEKNLGQTLNSQRAFYSLAKGKYCLFISDDDFLIDPLYISKAVKALEDNNDAAFAFSGYYYNNEVKNIAFRILPDYPEIIDGWDFFINFTRGKYSYMPNFDTTLFRRKNALSMNILKIDPNCLSSDLSILLRLLLSGNAVYIRNISLVYTLHKGSTTLNPGNSVTDGRDSIQKIVEYAVQDINELISIGNLAASMKSIGNDALKSWLDFRIWKYMYWRFNETVRTAEECRALVKFMAQEYPYLMQSLKNVVINRFGNSVMDVS